MAWQDRPYYRERGSTGWSSNPLMWLWNGSVPLGTWFGIRVRMHATMVIYILLTVLLAETRGGLGATNAVTAMTILFFSVLLHEFGHCFGARMMGGDAHEILMWPLGGLATTDPPRRWWPSFVTTAMGPLVNVAICLVTGIAIAILNRSAGAIPWFPLRNGLRTYVPHDWTTYYLWWIFLVNYALLAFNLLLVFYPFDGGRLVQELLWWRFGYYKSMRFATVFGMVGAAVVFLFGLATFSLMLMLIAGFGFFTCYQQRQMLLEAGPYGLEEDEGIDYSAAYDSGMPKPKRTSKWSAKRAARKIVAEKAEREHIDAILAKVSAHGMNSLTWLEKRALKKATEHQRQHELAMKRRGF
jgi:Zn-dependent protease